MSYLWDQLHDLFDTYDGGLEDIDVDPLTGEEVVNIYAYLRSHSAIVSDALHFWSKTALKDLPVDSVENAARLVVNGDADAFHIAVSGLSCNRATIPVLGIFVFDSSIELDYCPGPEWGVAELEALFAYLHEIHRLAPSTKITLTAGLDSVRERFASALEWYLGEDKESPVS